MTTDSDKETMMKNNSMQLGKRFGLALVMIAIGCGGAPTPEVGGAPATAASDPDGVDAGDMASAVDSGRVDSNVDAGSSNDANDAGADPDVQQGDASDGGDGAAPDAAPLSCPGFTKYTVLHDECLVLSECATNIELLVSPSNPNGGANFAGGATPDCSLQGSWPHKCEIIKDPSSTGTAITVVYVSGGCKGNLYARTSGLCTVSCP